MSTAFLPLAYTVACAFVLLSAFRGMALAFRRQSRTGDRTGLKTTHPELIDENGFITQEELLVVHFGGLDGNSLSVSSWRVDGDLMEVLTAIAILPFVAALAIGARQAEREED